MKKILTLIAAVCCVLTAAAQDTVSVSIPSAQEQALVYENPKIPIYIGDITYTPLTKGEKATTVITGLLNNEISIEDEPMVGGAMESLVGCLRDVNRFVIKTGEIMPEDMGKALIFSAKIVFCNFTEKLNDYFMDKEARIVSYITLTDPADNRIVFNKQVVGWTWLSIFNSMSLCRQEAQRNLWVSAANALRRAYPLRGHMLEKGFQKGKKQKLQELYIDLGTDHRIFVNTHVDIYIVKRIAGRIARQYLGSAKVIDVQGEDISLCKITKNANLIKQAFDRGAEIAVQVY